MFWLKIFRNHKRPFMGKRNKTHCTNRHFCNVLLSELRVLETECSLIAAEVLEVKNMITSLPPDVGTLIGVIERSAKEMHEQSITHREYVERCINGRSRISSGRKYLLHEIGY